MPALACADLSRFLGLPLSLVEKCLNSVSSDITVDAFLLRLDTLVDVKGAPSLLEFLKTRVQHVSEDLAAISFSSGTEIEQKKITQFFWISILAISSVYKNKRCVFECLVAILTKIHRTTYLLRQPMSGVDDITKVDELNTTIVLLLSRAMPQRFLLVFRRSIQPDMILHDSQVQTCLEDLSHHVRSVQGIGLPSRLFISNERRR
ncbi:hypothetical protein DL96DRAFT_894775 [Flagelloscypha sp. PMI_526]|nr:hypothetical protein DL96DRAFT_894775 [Flagelloscypha sp. PMI_526]